ncbi:MAG TPA: DUF4386 domain-containing protein [Steroidobacteraceae bacterium]|nr:DUF4386 domain-containing protein [Steroidobacteraceae bacterium]
MTTSQGTSITSIIRLTGAMYLIQMAAGVFTQMYARGSLVVSGDPTQTARNILDAERLFRVGIASDLLCYGAVLVASWGLYVLLRTVDRNIALLALLFRLIELSIHFNVTLNSLTALRLLSGTQNPGALDAGQLQALSQLALATQGLGIRMGFILLGIGSALFAWLLYKSSYIAQWIAGLGAFASLLLATFALAVIVFPETASLQMVSMLPMGLYEVALGVYLLMKAATVDQRASVRAAT